LCQDDVGLQANQLLRERSYPIGVSAGRAKVYPHVAAIGPTQVRERLRERGAERRRHPGVFVDEHTDAPYTVALLRPRRERPRRRRAADESDELSPPDADHGFPPGERRYSPLCSTKRIAPGRGGKQPAALRNFGSVDRAV
jgi:hypothetical protein